MLKGGALRTPPFSTCYTHPMHILASILVYLATSYVTMSAALAEWLYMYLPDAPADTLSLNEPAPLFTPTATLPEILEEQVTESAAAVIESATDPVADSIYDALVNILCTHKNGTTVRITTGSGFFIDAKGIILTNAHVAYVLLLDEAVGSAECVVRIGTPATPAYRAELLYISPFWVRNNAALFKEERPRGTGERDYALLYVTEPINNTPLPTIFPSLSFTTDYLQQTDTNRAVYIGGYPAETFLVNGPGSALVPKVADSTIGMLKTFTSQRADVLALTGSEIGERGSSGGPVVTTDGTLIGLISTREDETRWGAGALRAITLSYIDATMQEETGLTLRDQLSGDTAYRAEVFNTSLTPFFQLLFEQELDDGV